jgi:hypothetical protein
LNWRAKLSPFPLTKMRHYSIEFFLPSFCYSQQRGSTALGTKRKRYIFLRIATTSASHNIHPTTRQVSNNKILPGFSISSPEHKR